jgi:methylmalonyl-CoA/ethylmalonyl-CoA epimerase
MLVNGLRQVAQHVDDMDRAVAFYRDVLELEFIARFDPPGLAFFDLGSTRLLLEAGAPPAILYFAAPDVASATDRLRAAGVVIESEPHDIHVDQTGQFGAPGEAEVMSFFRDSEGNLLGLAGRRRLVDNA